MIRLLAFVIMLLSCSDSVNKVSEKEQGMIKEDIKQNFLRYCDDIRRKGLSAEFEYLDSSADFFWVPPGYSSAISYDSVASILKRNAPLLKSVDNVYEILRIVTIGKQHASYSAKVLSNVTDTSGKSSTTSLIETGVLVKRPTGWKLLSGQTTVIHTNP